MNIQTQVIHVACRDISHGQCCDIAKGSSCIVWLKRLHNDLSDVDVEAMRDSLGKIFKYLLGRILILNNKLVIQLPEETNLNKSCIGWLGGNNSIWRLHHTGQRSGDSGRSVTPCGRYRARCRRLKEDT